MLFCYSQLNEPSVKEDTAKAEKREIILSRWYVIVYTDLIIHLFILVYLSFCLSIHLLIL